MKTIRLTTCSSSIEAHLIQDLLKQEGISCILQNENISNIFGSATLELTGVDILVYEEDLEKAKALLQRRTDGEFSTQEE
ncbi:MAG: DUF2007 domain-containing protein [Bacteroidales bacterium]|nr:DUF2007 domain-containing protein [Bacteroidales bacterium]